MISASPAAALLLRPPDNPLFPSGPAPLARPAWKRARRSPLYLCELEKIKNTNLCVVTAEASEASDKHVKFNAHRGSWG